MQVGSLGKVITFEVTSNRKLIFQELSRTVKGRWQQHYPTNGKAKSQFLGADLEDITLQILLHSELGINPREVMTNIEKACEKGEANTFVIGGKKVGNNKWVITSISEKWNNVILDGRVVAISATLSLKEYI